MSCAVAGTVLAVTTTLMINVNALDAERLISLKIP